MISRYHEFNKLPSENPASAIQKIAISNREGVIVSSKNKKDEGKNFSTIGTSNLLTMNNTTIEKHAEMCMEHAWHYISFPNAMVI
ncbi:MAG: hypothetical protein JWQ25_2437 [Daejeonella sp.]|nr:hypothetical protein [Daejeonella sp.]